MGRTMNELFIASPIAPTLRAALERRGRVSDVEPSADTVAIVGGGTMRVDAALIERLPDLKVVVVHGVGHAGIDLDAARARGIPVTTTPDVLTDDVADLAVGLLLAVERRILANDRIMRAGGWKVPLSRRTSGRRVGIVGLGRIGSAIAHRLAAFGCDIAYTARGAKDVPWRYMPDTLALADFADALILAAPGGEETRHIVDAAVLRALGKHGVLVNVARGSLVDQSALIAALETATIAGAGLDVFDQEPHVPAALRLIVDRVVLSPHQGSATIETRAAMEALVLENLDAVLAGSAPVSPV
jgi:lactate dehydrogenase-like 2-hydroxyacid dehydrogenase